MPTRHSLVQEGIERHCSGMIVQFSTGGRGRDCAAGSSLFLKPNMASLSTGSVNFPTIAYENHTMLVTDLATKMRESGVRPEIEIFDLSDGCRYIYRMKATPDLIETAQCLCLASRRTARTITRAFDRELRTHGLRATQFTLLATLSLKGEQTISELAEFIDADRTTMIRNVAVAEEKNFVEVRRHEGDARVRVVTITRQGRETLAAALASWGKVQAGLTEAMGSDAADSLRDLAGSGMPWVSATADELEVER
jgi:DNA-binding MarR family transcriptional regulator